MRVRLSRPLDWLVIADHAEFSGVAMELSEGNPKLMTDERSQSGGRVLSIAF